MDHAREMGLALSAHGKWTAPQINWDHHAGRGTPYMAYHFAAQVVEVEVDMRTGVVQVVGFWAARDPGKVIESLQSSERAGILSPAVVIDGHSWFSGKTHAAHL